MSECFYMEWELYKEGVVANKNFYSSDGEAED